MPHFTFDVFHYAGDRVTSSLPFRRIDGTRWPSWNELANVTKETFETPVDGIIFSAYPRWGPEEINISSQDGLDRFFSE
ncbi:hypothetical protein M422DRAFT_275439, partial [Sphaerobolus stellatus SS14]